jgi:hypothetical protein
MELEEAGALIFLFSRLRKRRKKRRFWVHLVSAAAASSWFIKMSTSSSQLFFKSQFEYASVVMSQSAILE